MESGIHHNLSSGIQSPSKIKSTLTFADSTFLHLGVFWMWVSLSLCVSSVIDWCSVQGALIHPSPSGSWDKLWVLCINDDGWTCISKKTWTIERGNYLEVLGAELVWAQLPLSIKQSLLVDCEICTRRETKTNQLQTENCNLNHFDRRRNAAS